MLVRVVPPAQFLRDALESLARQTFREFEVIVIDMTAGAVDGLLDEYRERIPAIIQIRRPFPFPRPTALNTAVRASTSDRFALLDEDDVYEDCHLANVVEAFRTTHADLVHTGVQVVTYDARGEIIASVTRGKPYDVAQVLLENYTNGSAIAFTRDAWRRAGGFDDRFPTYEDIDFTLRVAEPGRTHFIPEVTVQYRSFTGDAAASNFLIRDPRADILRCRAGLYWKHRTKFFGRSRRQAYLAQLQAGGVEPRLVRDRLFQGLMRRRLPRDLIAWWWHNLRKS